MARKKARFKLAHAFFPAEGNGRHPHLLRRQSLAAALVLTIFVEIGFLTGFYSGARDDLFASVLPGVIAVLSNDARASQGLGSLAVSDILTRAAQMKADDMAMRGYFAHTSPDGKLPWYWFEKAGYDYKLAGENLAVNFNDSSEVVNAWLASPSHRDNLLKAGYKEIGIGIATGTYQGRATVFVVQFFGAQPSHIVQSAQMQTPPPKAKPRVVQAGPLNTGKKVLGTETSNISFLNILLASPRTYATYSLLALLAVFSLLLGISFAPLPRMWPHPSAILNGSMVIAIVFALLIINANLIVSVQLPEEGQSAAVSAPI